MSEGENNNNNTRERVNQLYKSMILDLKDKILSSLENAPDVVVQLERQTVITQNERISIISKPIRQHLKEALFYTIARKDFEDIDRIISALQITGNESIRASLLLLKIRIWKECKFSRNDVKIKPGIVSSDTYDMEDEDDNQGESLGEPSRTRKTIPRKRSSFIKTLSTDSTRIPLRPLKLEEQEDSFEIRIHQAASDGDVDSLKHWLKSSIHPYIPNAITGRTPLHVAVLGKNSKAASQCVELLIQREKELLELETNNENPMDKLTSFLNHKCKLGNTVLHLAAENECVEIVKQLYDQYQCDAFIRNNDGLTPLDLMYIKTPDAVVHLLNGALPTVSMAHLSDGKLNLEIDFRTIIGSIHSQNSNETYTETGMLAKLVHQDKGASKVILPHIIVKTFLDLKWEKMKMWLYTSTVLHILLHLWYTCFVVQVFLIACPHSVQLRTENMIKTESGVTGEKSEETQRTFFSYLFGDVDSVRQAFSIYTNGLKNYQTCDLPVELSYQAYAFIIIGICFMIKEIYEILLVKRIFSNRMEDRKCLKFLNGILAYLKSAENIFQLIFICLMCGVSTLAFRSNIILDFYYSAAAFSVVIAWALILMQVGNIYGLGTYVQILGKVIKSFATMIGTYMVLIIAFSIAFSILFPQDKPFETLPKSFSRVIIMMTGELNYDETFYNEEHSNQVPIPLAGHIIYTSFVVMVTIILINLLIGLTVSDVTGLRGKSEVILRQIQVEQLYVMENSLLRLGWILLMFKKLWYRIKGNKQDSSRIHLDIFVIHPNDIHSINGMVLKKSIKDIPKQLQREIRTLAGGADDYMREYLNKYSY